MSFLTQIAKSIKGHSCERLIKQSKNEFDIQGVGFGIADFKIEVGNFSNKIKEFYKVTNSMVSLDNTQYLLCTTMHSDMTSAELRDTCNRIRVMIIIGFNQLESLLGNIQNNPTDELQKKLEEWTDYMNQMSMRSMEAVAPVPRIEGMFKPMATAPKPEKKGFLRKLFGRKSKDTAPTGRKSKEERGTDTTDAFFKRPTAGPSQPIEEASDEEPKEVSITDEVMEEAGVEQEMMEEAGVEQEMMETEEESLEEVLDKTMKYQEIKDDEMQEALDILSES